MPTFAQAFLATIGFSKTISPAKMKDFLLKLTIGIDRRTYASVDVKQIFDFKNIYF